MALMLSACGKEGNKKTEDVNTTSAIEQKYPIVVENEGNPVKDATLKVAVVSDSPF